MTLSPRRSGWPHWLLPIAAVCFVMGALLAVQIRTYEAARTAMGMRPWGPFSGLLGTAQEQLRKQVEEIQDLQKKITRYETAAASEKALFQVMNDELQTSKTALGLTRVKGPGIVLTLDDSTFRLGDTRDRDLQQMLLVHSADLLQITNELWAAGAEAITIGDQRITANTPIRCVGPVIQVNGIAIPSPYAISAIGDPEVLTSALNLRGGVLDTMRSLKYRVKLVQQQKLALPALAFLPRFKLAKPMSEKEASSQQAGSP